MELVPCFALILIFALPLWLGPKQLEPISRIPENAPNVRFALIDLAAFVVLLTIMFALFRWAFRDASSEAFDDPAMYLLFASTSLMLLAVWGHGTRCLSAHGVHDWRARILYLLISPLAYIMPVVGVISLFFVLASFVRQVDGSEAIILLLLSIVAWPICRSMSKFVASKATIDVTNSDSANTSIASVPKEETFDPFAPKQ